MGQLAYGIVGAAIGFYFGGPTGAQVGWAVGTGVGAAVDPQKGQDGPRLDDRSIQVSTYGQPIPRIYGTQRTSGNVIWATDLLESEHQEGGKGGGPVYSTFSYSCSFAVGLCAGPIDGVLRIWADGKLIYDARPSNLGPQRSFTATSMTLYTGTEDQLPDPTMQAAEGDVPAYRGMAYMVFTDLQLEPYGNRIPNLSFEVVQVGTFAPRPPEETSPGQSFGLIDPETGFIWTIAEHYPVSDHSMVYVYDPATDTLLNSIELEIPSQHLAIDLGSRTLRASASWSSFGTHNDLATISLDAMALVGYTDLQAGGIGVYLGVTTLLDGDWLIGSIAGTTSHYIYYPPYTTGAPSFLPYVIDGTTGSWTLQMLSLPQHNVAVRRGWDSTVQFLQRGDSGWQVIATFNAAWASGGTQHLAYDESRGVILWTKLEETTYAYEIAASGASMTQVVFPTAFAGGITTAVYHPGIDRWIFMVDTATVLVHPDTMAVDRSVEQGFGATQLLVDPALTDRVYGTAVGAPPSMGHVFFFTDFLTPELISLATVVTAESDLVGLQPSDINVVELVPVMVQGFMVASGAVRSGIESLMHAYQFDAVESDGKVKFVLRGGDIVATLDDEDLAAHQPGNEVPSPLPLQRAEEVELPRSVSVRYNNPAADYQTGTQSAQRLTGRALADQGVDLPVVLSDAQAAQVAEAMLYSAWTARMSTSFVTTLKHAALEPTDAVSVGGNSLRIVRRTENAGLITFEAVFDSGAIYAQVSQGVAAAVPGQTLTSHGRTALSMLDIPPLRAQDADAGFYVAASGYRAGWPGAILFKSQDDGQSYEEMMLLQNTATIGVATTALADRSENTFDEFSSVTVRLRSGELYSASELAVLNGSNPALLGNELLQFKTATLNADGSYTLSGLLRGRKGTPTAGHLVGDRFVLLNTTLRRAPPVESEIDLARYYKAVTLGTSLAAATPTSFANTGNGLRPRPPAHLRGGRASNDLYINWVRRALVQDEWRDGVDVDGGANGTNLFRINVYSNSTYSTVVRTWTTAYSTGFNGTYTAAQQTTDFGSPQATVYVGVCEVSAVVGDGHLAFAAL